MTAHIVLGVICALIAGAILVSLLHDLVLWAWQKGYECGCKDERAAWFEAGRQVDQARQEIWREEATP